MGGITTIINKAKYAKYTKYIGIASLTIAILSILILNIIFSYSSSNTESNAEEVGGSTSTQANNSSICDPTNTNAASCISLSITSSSSSTDSNNPNLSLQIPREGGIAVGRHTVSVSSNNVTGYYVTLTGNAGSPAMVPSTPTSQAFIQSTTGTLTSPSPLAKGQWGSWGIALPNSSLYPGFNTNEADYNSTNQDTLAKTIWAAVPSKEADDNVKTIIKTTISSKATDTYSVYYGARVDNPASTPADTYAAQVVYTATTNEAPAPSIISLDPSQYELGSGASNQITINGTNLRSAYSVYIANTNGDKVGDCTSIQVASDTHLTCTIPTDQTNPDLEAGDYAIYVVTQGGEASIRFTYTEKKALSVYDSVDNVRVDYDENMIPIYYTGNSSTPRWTSLNSMQIEQNTATWFDYSGSRSNGEIKWANAVTVKDPSKYKDKSLVVDEADILGYWVYIPRYAYMVMRRDATDKVVTDEEAATMGGFNIRFETVDDLKKTPAACPYSSSSTYYYDCVPQSYPGNNESLIDRSAWATHPAFTWQYTKDTNGFDQTVELNGFWIGKFETTGTAGSPTVLPNKYHLYDGNIGDYYDIAQSIGIEDPNNLYGNAESPNYNNGRGYHGLSYTTSHMLKNSEWGAVAYLASSKYGAGVNEVQVNDSYVDGATGNGPNGGRYNTANGQLASTTNNVYGIYDMAGGAIEYVMGSYATNTSQSSTMEFANATRPPYVDLYLYTVFVNGDDLANNNKCTWATCGGHALHETKNVQLVSTKEQSWGDDYSFFVYASSPWFKRGGYSYNSKYAGLFASYYGDGFSQKDRGFRVTLLINT